MAQKVTIQTVFKLPLDSNGHDFVVDKHVFCVPTAMVSTLSLGLMMAHSLFGKSRQQILCAFCEEMTRL